MRVVLVPRGVLAFSYCIFLRTPDGWQDRRGPSACWLGIIILIMVDFAPLPNQERAQPEVGQVVLGAVGSHRAASGAPRFATRNVSGPAEQTSM
jgi:hypothetical protein